MQMGETGDTQAYMATLKLVKKKSIIGPCGED